MYYNVIRITLSSLIIMAGIRLKTFRAEYYFTHMKY